MVKRGKRRKRVVQKPKRPLRSLKPLPAKGQASRGDKKTLDDTTGNGSLSKLRGSAYGSI